MTASGRPLRRLGRRPVLDGLRGVAILLVMLMHTAILHNGFIGVDVFFALSGFLITSLLLEEWDATRALSLRRFYERRARRLLPGLLLLVGIYVILDRTLAPFTGWPVGLRVLTTLTFVNNWVTGLGYQGLGVLSPTWSLAVEDQFYVLWPLALLVLLSRRTSPRRMIAYLLLTGITLAAVVPLAQHLIAGYSLYYSPLDRFAELLAGCIAAIAWRHRLIPRLLERRAVGWLALAGVLALLAVPDNTRTGEPTHIVAVYLLAAAGSAVLILHLLENGSGRLARLIGCRPLRATGRISYGLYLYNLLVHNLVQHWLGGHSTLFYVAIDFAITFLLAGLSWRLLESRVLAAGAHRAHRTSRPDRGRPRLQPAG